MVVEADFRRPTQARLLGLGYEHPQGLADVLAEGVPPSSVMQRVGVSAPADADGAAGAGAATAVLARQGALCALRGTAEIPNPPAVLGRPEMSQLLAELAQEFDNVLIDAPPPLQFSDALTMLASVDGIVIVARVDHTRQASARRLMQLLERTPSAPLLGVVANAARRRDMERYGFSSGPSKGRLPLGLSRR